MVLNPSTVVLTLTDPENVMELELSLYGSINEPPVAWKLVPKPVADADGRFSISLLSLFSLVPLSKHGIELSLWVAPLNLAGRTPATGANTTVKLMVGKPAAHVAGVELV